MKIEFKNTRKHLNFSNAIFAAALLAVLILKYPQIKENFATEGEVIQEQIILSDLLSKQSIRFPSSNKQIIVFWATWCGPCKIELDRLDSLVKKNKILKEQVLAISIDENSDLVTEYLKKNPYSFLVAFDQNSELAKKFNIVGTPTVLFVDEKNKVKWRTTGISPSLGLRAQSFL